MLTEGPPRQCFKKKMTLKMPSPPYPTTRIGFSPGDPPTIAGDITTTSQRKTTSTSAAVVNIDTKLGKAFSQNTCPAAPQSHQEAMVMPLSGSTQMVVAPDWRVTQWPRRSSVLGPAVVHVWIGGRWIQPPATTSRLTRTTQPIRTRRCSAPRHLLACTTQIAGGRLRHAVASPMRRRHGGATQKRYPACRTPPPLRGLMTSMALSKQKP